MDAAMIVEVVVVQIFQLLNITITENMDITQKDYFAKKKWKEIQI